MSAAMVNVSAHSGGEGECLSAGGPIPTVAGRDRERTMWMVVVSALAIWPVWWYLWKAYDAAGADQAPPLVLVSALGWALVKWWPSRNTATTCGPLPAVLLAAYAGAYVWLPPLARATLGLAAFGAALVALPGVGFRTATGLWVLMLLSAPSAETVSFFLGGPIRAASAQIAAAWLHLGSVPVSVEGAMLRVGMGLFSVDAPCSGVNGLWSGMVVATCLAVHRRLGPVRTVCMVIAAAVLCVPANGWRAASLVYLSRLSDRGATLDWDLAHSLVGVMVFAVTIGALSVLVRVFSREPKSTRDPDLGGPALRSSALQNHWWFVIFLVTAATASTAPAVRLALPRGNQPDRGNRFPGWPETWLGQPLRRLPETDLDQRWAALSPAPLARFALSDGGELLLRWTDQSGRWLHPPEDCYRGHGYSVSSLPPVRAAVPGHREPVVWRRFEARKEGERLEVKSIILSASGATYPDPAWWWWRVSGPGAEDHGPWWVATVQR